MSFRRITAWSGVLAAVLAAGIYFSDSAIADAPAVSLTREILSPEEIYSAQEMKLQKSVDARIARIRAEVARLKDHPWAGEYFGGIKGSMAISPNAGVAVISGGCFRLSATRDSVRKNEKGWLEISPAKDEKGGYGDFSAALIPIHWGARRYLIPEDELDRFAADINLGYEPRRDNLSGAHYLLDGDERKPVTGLPDIPADYLKKIRSVAVDASVRDVKLLEEFSHQWGCTRRYRVTLDKGESDGLHVADRLLQLSPGYPYPLFEVAEVKAHTATGELAVDADNCSEKGKWPDRSWKFSTGAYTAN